MPTPRIAESEKKFVARCVPILIAEGRKPDQAVAICHSMWKNRKKTDGRPAGMRAAFTSPAMAVETVALENLPEPAEIKLPPQLRSGYLENRDIIAEELKQP